MEDPKPSAADRAPFTVGTVFEGFTLRDILGEGSFAWVYEATHPDYRTPVAIKISKAPVDSEETALRALREIRILGSLSNPHVVHIYDHGLSTDERWFMVMELLEGASLRDVHDFDRPLQPAEAVRVIHQACLGLDEAHRAGVVHRDVKPENLWVCHDRTVKVLDFGLARAWDTSSTIGANATMGHMLIGTPHYAQPEQVATGRLTPASDVYSLAFILYELLSSRVPLFADESVSAVRDRLADTPLQWLVAHVKQPVVPLRNYPETARLPKRLIDVIERALAKEPTARPASAGELANELAWVLHHDLGRAQGAVLKVQYPSGSVQKHLLLPGVHRIGVGAGHDISLATDDSPRTFAVLEWTGAPRDAELYPLVQDGTVRVNGHPLTYRVRLVPGTFLHMGPFRLELHYPSTQAARK